DQRDHDAARPGDDGADRDQDSTEHPEQQGCLQSVGHLSHIRTTLRTPRPFPASPVRIARMSAIERMIEVNRSYSSDGSIGKHPTLDRDVLTCMDTRVVPVGPLGREPGVAHVIGNAVEVLTPDVLRSLAISQRAL